MRGIKRLLNGSSLLCCPDNFHSITTSQLIFSDCTALPADIPNLKTSTELPVQSGTRVEVGCEDGYILLGNNVIICKTDKDWEYAGNPPQCESASGFSELFKIIFYHYQ